MSGGPIFQKKIQSAHDRKDSKTIRRVGRGGGGGGEGGATPTGRKGPPEKSKRQINTRKKNAKNESFLAICQRTQLFTV